MLSFYLSYLTLTEQIQLCLQRTAGEGGKLDQVLMKEHDSLDNLGDVLEDAPDQHHLPDLHKLEFHGLSLKYFNNYKTKFLCGSFNYSFSYLHIQTKYGFRFNAELTSSFSLNSHENPNLV